MHVAKADVLGAGIDLQRCGLLLQRTDDDTVADGHDGLLPRMASAFAVAVRRAGRRTDVLALMPEAGGALAHLEAAGFAKIVPPRIDTAAFALALAKLLRADQGRGVIERKTDLRIGGEVGASAAPTHAATGNDVAARVIGEVARNRRRPFSDLGRNVVARLRRLSARDAQGFQKALGNGIGLATGQPPRPRRRVQTLDRHHVGHAESREGVAHIAFADEAAHVGELRRQRVDRFALAAERIGEVVDEDRAGDLHVDRPSEGPRRQTRASA